MATADTGSCVAASGNLDGSRGKSLQDWPNKQNPCDSPCFFFPLLTLEIGEDKSLEEAENMRSESLVSLVKSEKRATLPASPGL